MRPPSARTNGSGRPLSSSAFRANTPAPRSALQRADTPATWRQAPLPAVEPGILARWMERSPCPAASIFGCRSGRQDAALYGRQGCLPLRFGMGSMPLFTLLLKY